MVNNRQNSGSKSKSASTPVDYYRRSIGKHQEKILSESNLRKKQIQYAKKQDEEQKVTHVEPTKKAQIAFIVGLVLMFGGIYLLFKLMMTSQK